MKWDVKDPNHRLYLETARRGGVSPSTFMGEKTFAVSEQTGGQTVYTASPEWTDEDREAALDLAVYESDLCPGCGYPMSETTAPENENQYITDLPIRCHRCTASEQGMGPY